MKRLRFWFFAVVAIATANIVVFCAQDNEDQAPVPYFTQEELPEALNWLPQPPADSSEAYKYDVAQYNWGKEMRLDSVRAAIAKRDADYGVDCMMREFSEPLGVTMTKQTTPELYTLLRDAGQTCDMICWNIKSHYMRPRPFMVMNEPTLTPDDEVYLRNNGSYPSGHTILGWSTALILSSINPERADTILARGLMYGESRVIVGAHWQSDVNAGFVAAAAAYAKLQTSPRFLEQLEKARKEFDAIYKQK